MKTHHASSIRPIKKNYLQMKKVQLYIPVAISALALLFSSCKDEQSPGIEYMPDMYRSPSIEAYVDYENIEEQSARKPVPGTIVHTGSAINSTPYPFPNTPEGYEEAGLKLKNPIPYSEAVAEEGKVLYNKFCVHCHGETGDGDGSVVKILTEQRDNYALKPPSYSKNLADLPEGKIFHTITYGKNNMGAHASQLTKEERWKVVYHVQKLQGKQLGAVAQTQQNN
jgi:mono/diheme cytochrome c family protein